MLDRRQRPSWSERPQSAVDGAARTVGAPWRQPRLVVALLLIAGGVGWAIVRGLEFYGWSFVHLGYDLDQPPLLLMFVAAWLTYRSRS